MHITSEQRTKLTQGLFDKMIELRKGGETNISIYSKAFHNVIEEVFPNEYHYNITECDILNHLMEHKDPEATVIAILKGLKEG